ncbi:hypothetical protein [Saccharothrix sp. Mg75]|uniref:hypothetical protein n=1 Tax=Saccharothrix sp. Mg75 TaxID=3445357 RepID=UPI003EEF7F91
MTESPDGRAVSPDGRAVRRALRPRRTWPWPDLEARVAEVRGWAEAGVELGGPLRRLTWPVVRRRNAGFVPALLSRGVPVPDDVVAAARRALRALVGGHAPDTAWRRYARWHAELDPDDAAECLAALARTPSRHETERYRAFDALHGISPERAVPVAGELVLDPRVRRTVRIPVGQVLARHDLPTALAVFERVAARSDDGAVLNDVAEFFRRHDPARAFALSATTAANRRLPDAERLTAARHAFAHDPGRGVALLADLVDDAAGDDARGAALDELRRVAPDRLAGLLDDRRRTAAPERRLYLARYLVERLGRGPEVVVDLASDRTVPVELRLRALDVDRRATTAEVLEGVVADAGDDFGVAVRAVALLAPLSPDSAFEHLHRVATDRRFPFRDRARAVKAAAGHLGQRQRTALHRDMALGAATARERADAVAALVRTDPREGRELCAQFARRGDLPVDERLWFTGKTGSRTALELLRGFVRDRDEDPALRVKAAREAVLKGGDEDAHLLRRLAATPTVPYSFRKGLVADLEPADRTAVLGTIADSAAEHPDTRLAAGIALGDLDPAGAAAKLDELARDRRTPLRTRGQAHDAAARLR